MSDIRKANPFIEAGFELLKQIPELVRQDPYCYPHGWCAEHCYLGTWDAEDFDPGCDDCFYLSCFEPDFRLYYGIASLNFICKGGDWFYGEALGEYIFNGVLDDCRVTNFHTGALGVKMVMNGLQVVPVEELTHCQKIFINSVQGIGTNFSTFGHYQTEGYEVFSFEAMNSNLVALSQPEVITECKGYF